MSASSTEHEAPVRTRDGSNLGGSSISCGSLSEPPDQPEEKIRNPEEGERNREKEETPAPHEERDTPPGSPYHKYAYKEVDFVGLDSISDERSFALRVSDNYKLGESQGVAPGEGDSEETSPPLVLVEMPCQCLDAPEKWNERPENPPTGQGGLEEKPFKERWEEEALIKALLCSEELSSSEERDEEGNPAEEVESSPRPAIRMINEIGLEDEQTARPMESPSEEEQKDLVEVPPASTAEELEELAALTAGLSPEQIAE